jgi:DNA repair exonuclease SbcCD ATPase subunit
VTERERIIVALERELDGRASPGLLRSSLERAYDAGAAATCLELGSGEIFTERDRLRAQVEELRTTLFQATERNAELTGAREERDHMLATIAEQARTLQTAEQNLKAAHEQLREQDAELAEQARRIEQQVLDLEQALREIASLGTDVAPAYPDGAGAFHRRQLHTAIGIAGRALSSSSTGGE